MHKRTHTHMHTDQCAIFWTSSFYGQILWPKLITPSCLHYCAYDTHTHTRTRPSAFSHENKTKQRCRMSIVLAVANAREFGWTSLGVFVCTLAYHICSWLSQYAASFVLWIRYLNKHAAKCDIFDVIWYDVSNTCTLYGVFAIVVHWIDLISIVISKHTPRKKFQLCKHQFGRS